MGMGAPLVQAAGEDLSHRRPLKVESFQAQS